MLAVFPQQNDGMRIISPISARSSPKFIQAAPIYFPTLLYFIW